LKAAFPLATHPQPFSALKRSPEAAGQESPQSLPFLSAERAPDSGQVRGDVGVAYELSAFHVRV
jgi:hypothetical protein